MTPTATTTPTTALVQKFQDVFGKDGFLCEHNIGREDVAKLLAISVLSNNDAYLLGDPGVGKTYIIELTLACITDARLFDILLLKDMSPDDIIGPRSLTALKQDKLERLIDGFLPTAHLGYVDEWDKGNATTLNALLDLTAKRQLKVGGKVIDCSQLLAILFSGNAMHDREDLTAITDRLGIKKFVPAVRSPEQRKAVMRIQMSQQQNGKPQDDPNRPMLTLDEIEQAKAEAAHLVVPDTIIDRLDEAQEKFTEAGFPPSARKVGQWIRAIKADAWLNEQDEVVQDNLLIVKDMAWNRPDQARKAEDIIVEFASEFARKAKYAREALEPIKNQMDEVKKAVDEAGGDETAVDEALGPAYDLLRNLRRLKKDTRQQIAQGDDDGHDTSSLNEVLGEITKLEGWAESTFTGEDMS